MSSSLSFHPKYCFVFLSPYTRYRMLEQGFVVFSFSFYFSTLIPPYPEDPSPANSQLDFYWWVPFLSLFYGQWWTRFAVLPLSRKIPKFWLKPIACKQPTTPPLVASSNYQHKTHIKQIRVFTIYHNMYEIRPIAGFPHQLSPKHKIFTKPIDV